MADEPNASAQEGEDQDREQALEAEQPAAAEEQAAPEAAAPQPEADEAEQPAAAEHESAAAEQEPAAAEEEPAAESEADEDEEEEEPAPRVKPEVPGLHLEVDIVPEGADPLGRGELEDPYATDPYASEEERQEEAAEVPGEEQDVQSPISAVTIDLASGARYKATGKRKTAIARVILRPGGGEYLVNGRSLEQYFPRATLQRNIRQPLETVGYQEKMDVVARLHGGGNAAQADALRHGVSRALLEADPNLRGELKRRGFLTRDSRVKERKKAGLKKARKRPQFSKR